MNAQDKLPPPPYQMAGTNHVLIGVVWMRLRSGKGCRLE
jgi:hypothetical protein